MPRFVVLTHNHPAIHWDLMLEKEAALRTWKLFQAPDQFDSIAAQQLPDHRLLYLDYEGSVSNNRGEVSRWDWGEYAIIQEDDSQITFQLSGQRLIGRAILDRGTNAENWSFRFESVHADVAESTNPVNSQRPNLSDSER